MAYHAIVYYSWIVGAGVWLVIFVKLRRSRGTVFLGVGALVQIGAHILHIAEWRRLRGTPDSLYVWIAPLAIALLGTVIWIAGILRQNLGDLPTTNRKSESGRRGDLTPAPHTTGHTDP